MVESEQQQQQSQQQQQQQEVTSETVLKSVTAVLTRVPKRALKNYFVRHCAANLKDIRQVQRDWVVLSKSYEVFKKNFATLIADNDFYQRLFVQLAMVSSLLGKIDPSNDTYGLYGGAALFVSEWCRVLGSIFFPQCHELAFFALWSPFLKSFNVSWAFHGTSRVVLMSLAQEVDAADGDPFALLFPGPSPCRELAVSADDGDDDDDATIGVEGWAAKSRHFESNDDKALFMQIFGVAGRLSSRQVQYYNPADETLAIRRKYDDCWAIDAIAPPADVAEFEKEDLDEDTGEFVSEMANLSSMLLKTSVTPPAPPSPAPPSSSSPPSSS